MKTKIYTKTGDSGDTSLFGGGRVLKSNERLNAYGTVDELNAAIGVVLAEAGAAYQLKTVADTLVQTQNVLFNVGSHLACADLKLQSNLPKLSASFIERLEKEIDELEKSLPELKDFILPGGSKVAALLHLARTVCRRTERLTIFYFESAKSDKKSAHPPKSTQEFVVTYLNRLGDYLFVAARAANQLFNHPEVKWEKIET